MVPLPLEDALIQAFYTRDGGYMPEDAYEEFASRCGGISLDICWRVLEDGASQDKVIAMLAISYTSSPLIAETLVPFLSSSRRMERWFSAIRLGEMKDERALPALEALLLDGLSLDVRALAYQHAEEDDVDEQIEHIWRCRLAHSHVISLLETCHTPSLVSTLRRAFKDLWLIDQTLGLYDQEEITYDELAYALGQREAFEVVAELELPPAYRKTAMIFLSLGYLHTQLESDIAHQVHMNSELQQHIASVLEQIFGLSKEEQQDCIQHFYENAYRARQNYYYLKNDQKDDDDDDDDDDDEEEEEHDTGDDDTIEVPTLPMLCLYTGHQSPVYSVAWSPDGTMLVSGSRDGTAQVWNASTGEMITTFRGHTASVNAVAWSPQGGFIASGGSDTTICVWHALTGEAVCVYRGHTALIYTGLVWSPDATRVASASWDGTVQVWEAFSGERLHTYCGHKGIVHSLAWSPDGGRLASGGGYPECKVDVWDAQTGVLDFTYRMHMLDVNKERPLRTEIIGSFDEENARQPSSVHSLVWSPDGTRLASAGLRQVDCIWNATTGETIVYADRNDGPLAWSPDSKYLILADIGYDTIDLWDVITKKVLARFKRSGFYEIAVLVWSPEGKRIAASGNNTVMIFNIE